MIVASTLTSKEVDDAAELGALLDQVEEPLAAVVADGAYDQDRVYDDVAEHSAEAAVVVPPRATAVLSASAETNPTQRDRHIQVIAEQGRMNWQKTSGYNARAGAEGAMSRYKRIIGDTLRSHTRRAQEVETRMLSTSSTGCSTSHARTPSAPPEDQGTRAPLCPAKPPCTAAMFRYKKLIGRSLHARTLPTQKTEAKVACKVINIMTGLGMPVSRLIA